MWIHLQSPLTFSWLILVVIKQLAIHSSRPSSTLWFQTWTWLNVSNELNKFWLPRPRFHGLPRQRKVRLSNNLWMWSFKNDVLKVYGQKSRLNHNHLPQNKPCYKIADSRVKRKNKFSFRKITFRGGCDDLSCRTP